MSTQHQPQRKRKCMAEDHCGDMVQLVSSMLSKKHKQNDTQTSEVPHCTVVITHCINGKEVLSTIDMPIQLDSNTIYDVEELDADGDLIDWENPNESYLQTLFPEINHYHIILPDSTTTIEELAFCNCSSLISITLPNMITTIEKYAFWSCKSLTSITLPDSITNIGHDAFSDCESLTSITLPDSITTIGNHAFSGCESLTSITLPNSITTINYTFAGCISLTSITLPDSITTIGNHAFYRCESLKSITLPNSITTIGNHTFNGCKSLKSITLPNSITTIGESAFAHCSSLTSIHLSKSTLIKHSSYFQSILEEHKHVKLNLIEDITRQCTICNEHMDLNVMFTKCGHVSFCLTCCMRAKYLFRQNALVNCPLCRKQHRSSEVEFMTHTT